MKLYHHPLSGNAHRARLMLSLLNIDAELILVDLMSGAQKQPAFLALNPLGQVPVLVDGDTVISDSNAILVYLAKKFNRTDWLPDDAEGSAGVQRWLAIASGQIAYGPAAARMVTLFNASFNADEVIARSHAILKSLDDYMADRSWFVGDHPTIADVSLFTYIDRAPEGNIDLTAYENLRQWLARVEALPGFVPIVQTEVGLLAAE